MIMQGVIIWDYFVTFTFSKEKVNRYDYDVCSKKISQWIKDLKEEKSRYGVFGSS